MARPRLKWFLAALSFALLLSACRLATPNFGRRQATATPRPTRTQAATQAATAVRPTAAPAASPTAVTAANVEQVARIGGEFTYTNDIITIYYSEHMVALVDMYGFVTRDKEWEIPVESQVLGFMDLDPAARTGSFSLDLPVEPRASLADVDQDGETETGLQIFAAAYWPNLLGGPYSEGDDRSWGWPNYLASVQIDTENQDEVTGGRLILWAPDTEQEFPTGFGSDGLLFTEDDPVGPIPAGYSVVDLDAEPFEILRDQEVTVELYEPADVAVKDFTGLSYTDAFDKLFEQVRKEYAFQDIEGKAPDWDSLYAELQPQVEAADQDNDALAFYRAMKAFTDAFQDGHVGLFGGELEDQVFAEITEGGFGLAIRELEGGEAAVITYITPGGPAEEAGLAVGDRVTEFNGEPVGDAIGTVTPFSGPFSTEFSRRYQQARYLLRAPLGTEITLTYSKAGSTAEETATLTSVSESDSFTATSIYANADPNALPVEYRILESGVGYVRVNSNYDDLNLIIRLFERALQIFSYNQVPGVIIDLRYNSGGAPLSLAGFLTDTPIPLGQLEYYSDATGEFEPDGPREEVLPYENQYRFPKLALLVGQACASACEIEAYGFSQIEGMTVIGETPTAGVEAEVARGQFLLPEGQSLQIPTGRFTLPDGSIFLEGVGVEPTIPVAATEENLLAEGDVVLQTAETELLRIEGQGVEPSGAPTVASDAEAQQALQQGASVLEDLAREQYSNVSQAGETYAYTIVLQESEPLLWMTGWCAENDVTLAQNSEHIQYVFTLDGEEVPLADLTQIDFDAETGPCRYFYTALDKWPGGEHHLSIEVTFDEEINDGSQTFPAGTHVYEYTVYVKPDDE